MRPIWRRWPCHPKRFLRARGQVAAAGRLAAATTDVVSLAFVRVALISDLHGNMVALRAVLEHIGRTPVDQIVCLGDVATLGPAPQRVVETLAELGCPCIVGNHDEFLLNAELIHSYTEIPVIVESVDACRASLGPAELNVLRTFQPTLELDMDGAVLSLFHGSPRSHMENLLARASPRMSPGEAGLRLKPAPARRS